MSDTPNDEQVLAPVTDESMSPLEAAQAEIARLEHIIEGGAHAKVGGPPGQSIEADHREAVTRASMKVDKQIEQLAGAEQDLAEAQRQLDAYLASDEYAALAAVTE